MHSECTERAAPFRRTHYGADLRRHITSCGAEPLVAYLMPLTSDGVIASASTVIYTAGRQNRRGPWVAWPLLACGIGVTIVANGAAVNGHGAGAAC